MAQFWSEDFGSEMYFTDSVTRKESTKKMERKLYNYIMMPAMLLSWLFGILLIHSLGLQTFSELWMQVKTVWCTKAIDHVGVFFSNFTILICGAYVDYFFQLQCGCQLTPILRNAMRRFHY